MTIQLTASGLRNIFARAPQVYLDEMLKGQRCFDEAGITASRTRLSYCFANVEHETGCFTIRNLTESIAYNRPRALEVWPNRRSQIIGIPFDDSTPEFRRALINLVYGGRMGNRPGTDDGVRYIGRGGPQITGRDGYAEIGRRTGLPLVEQPDLAGRPEHQAAIIAAFWSWKGLNRQADAGDFMGCVKLWNGGFNGLKDRELCLRGNQAAINALPMAA